MPRTMTKTAPAIRVMLSRASTLPPVLKTDYAAWADTSIFLAEWAEARMAPQYGRGFFVLDLSGVEGAPRHAWTWRTEIAEGDRLAIATAGVEGALWFEGFVIEVEAGWNDRDEWVRVTCASPSFRLARDVLVYGRWMWNSAGTPAATHYSGLSCRFNAGGRPNRHATRETLEGGPERGVSLFAPDGDPDAEFWSMGDILDYLAWRYNAAEVWCANAVLNVSTDYDGSVTVECEGMNLWQALAAAADADGYDVWDEPSWTEGGLPQSTISVKRRGAGTVRTVQRQDVGEEGEHVPLDLALTNSFGASLAESSVGAVTRPVVAGGREIVEITVPLGQAWDPANLDLDEDEDPTDPDEDGDYAARYLTSGADHAGYADVARLWDANADNRYHASPITLTCPDMAALADETAGTWPRLPYPGREMVSCAGDRAAHPSAERLLEFSIDSGSTWHVVKGYEPLSDRLGVRLTLENVADLWADPDDDATNLFSALASSPSTVKMRLTCSVESPKRAVSQPAWSAGAGSVFQTAEWFDRGELGQKRRVASSSRMTGLDVATDAADGGAALTAAAVRIQAAAEMKALEAGLPFEWPDVAVGLSDVVQEIGGIDYDLAVRGGASPRYPRVVAWRRHLTAATWGMVLVLDTPRKLHEGLFG